MSALIDREGLIRGSIIEYELRELDSGAVSCRITVEIDDFFQDGNWENWRDYSVTATGDIWLVKKNGDLNQRQGEALCEYAGWDGSFNAISSGKFSPNPLAATVEADEYQGQISYRIAWLQPYDYTPGRSAISSSSVSALDQKHGSALRAIASTSARNCKTPESAPRPSRPKPEPLQKDEIPF